MTMVSWSKADEVPAARPLNCRRKTSLAAVESLAMPLVQEVVFLADFRCGRCQKRVAEIMSKMNAIKLGSHQSSLSGQALYMVMRINLDCNACCRKMRRILLRMKESHFIDKQLSTVTVYGRFVPADLAITIRKRMKRRVEILEIQEPDRGGNVVDGYVEEMPPVLAQPV
ncbi:uncharacterized protein LOC127245646 isoform X2 [Andrographis paniculata]|uniref:uncharacterized protein LOC127245646 isoform X2 n=1 Tax=Andrographis paniculata TaxID=175694 RepID=UPI0021E70336|nr:uncharacterized protein LOC127245646 isoform X2 [Andrographis paniculata]